ncbi:MAG: hypothetical protein V4662_08770 [Verrucomicrobiota bacterium]
MKKSLAPLFLLALSMVAAEAQGPTVRTWTNQQGRTVKASLVEVSGAHVIIQLENGTKTPIALATLSQSDQDYVKNLPQAPAGAAATPAAAGALAWPKEPISVDPKTIEVKEGRQDEKARRYHYTAGSFEYICTAPLAGTVMSEVAADFVLVEKAFLALPWGFKPRPAQGDFFQIYLTETDEDYIALGGDDRSASMTSRDGKSLVRFRTLGLKKVGARYQYDARQKEPGQVTNMVAHVMLENHDRVFYPWSGLAVEQFTRNLAYQDNGTLKYTGLESALKKEIKFRASVNAAINLPRMLKYMRQSWLEPAAGGVVQKQHEDRLDGQLLMYFFGYLEGDGSGTAWHRYCREVFSAPELERNADNYARGEQLFKQLTGGRDDNRLTAEMTEKFKGIGIKLEP